MKCKLIWIADKTYYGYDEQEIIAKTLRQDTDWEEIDQYEYIKLVGFVNDYKSKYGERLYLIRQPEEYEITLSRTVSEFLEAEEAKKKKEKKIEDDRKKKSAEIKRKRDLKKLEKLKKQYEQ